MEPAHHYHLSRTMIWLIVVGSLLFIGGSIITIIAVSASRSIEYSKASDTQPVVSTTQQAFSLPSNTSYIPDTLDPSSLLMIAKNQPAVVRILSVYCADIILRTTTAEFDISNACSGGVGSGSLISSDGYIATNGHVVSVTPRQALVAAIQDQDVISEFFGYLVDSKALSVSEANGYITTLNNGTSDPNDVLIQAAATIRSEAIEAKNQQTQYAVQLSNEPMRIDRSGERIIVELTNTVVSGTLIDKNFNADTADQELSDGQFTTSDVALLKVEGSYPYVILADNASISIGDQLTAIGFPAFIDGSVDTTQWQTVPSITQGMITDIQTDNVVNGRTLFATTVPIAQGNSGGPAFNTLGLQVGINTYSDIQCEDLNCFGDGLVRDGADLQALIVKNNITLKQDGVTSIWHKALDAFAAKDYGQSLSLFDQVKSTYPANYLAASFARESRSHVNGPQALSSLYQQSTVTAIVIWAVGIMIALVVVSAVTLSIYYAHRRHRHRRRLRFKTPI
jgi:S1-C subfamily serine protease